MKKTIRTVFVFFVAMLLFTSVASAGLFSTKDITFSVEQKEYYFKVNEVANIPLHIENTYNKNISGTFTNSYTQESNQGGVHMVSSNSQSIPFYLSRGESIQELNFGTSSSPLTLTMNLRFSYTENEERVVYLNDIIIYFVADESQKQDQQDQQSSSSQKKESSQQDKNSQQDEMQKKQEELQNKQQALQNNQMSQDSNALKQQMQKQMQEEQELQEKFQENLAQNPDFQKEHQKLLEQGYNLTNVDANPSSENTGDFKLDYKKQNGESASMQGELNNGTLENIHTDSLEQRNELMDILKQDKKFQEFQEKLVGENYSQEDIQFSQNENTTTISIDYVGGKNETATLSANIENKIVKKVTLDGFDSRKKFIWWLIILIGMLLVGGYVLYRKLQKKSSVHSSIVKIKPALFNYKLESNKLLKKSKQLFEKKQYKDAYGTAGQALRLHLSYTYGLNKEITNDELVVFLRKQKKDCSVIKKCFDSCSLVEFAKYKANRRDFEKNVYLIQKIFNSSK